MSRIPTPTSIDEVPVSAKPLLEAVNSKFGKVPNMFRLLATSPQALEGYHGLNGALAKGKLNAATRERIALAVANVNGCTYCNSAHAYFAANLAMLDAAEIAANRDGRSNDPKADAAVRLARKIAAERGSVTDADLQSVRLAGYSDAEIIEIVVNVALNVLTNYVNDVFKTDVDFPVAEARRAA
ncbi:peroxidase-related enzyme [Methylocapsa polymorpha]|uniref:Peroxidase-related enzyme n=1 Tax=Methylocapsa polymorpha TaxID=3080828 RepID=A0ABZ0HUP4_9HYPH|nr:peroxidase-related enzyme [Methylocapsa sp. RX1]